MLRALAALLVPLFLLMVSTTAAAAERPRPRWHLGTASDPNDVAFVPIGLAIGGAVLVDGRRIRSGMSTGLDAFSGTRKLFAWTAAQLRMQLYTNCGTGSKRECGPSGDYFVGSRAGLAFALDHERKHMLTTTMGLGWGAVGHETDPTRGGLIASPAIRYTFAGFFGLEVQAFVVAKPAGDRFPAAVALNLVLAPMRPRRS